MGGLFLFDTTKTQTKSENTENYAQIIQELSGQNSSQTSKPKVTNKPSKTPTKTLTPSTTLPILSPTPSELQNRGSSISQPNPSDLGEIGTTPTFSPSPSLSPTPTQTQQPTATPTTNHIYYASSYATAKYYYCDTDDSWKTLSTKYLKSFSSPEELLKTYPTRILHEGCK